MARRTLCAQEIVVSILECPRPLSAPHGCGTAPGPGSGPVDHSSRRQLCGTSFLFLKLTFRFCLLTYHRALCLVAVTVQCDDCVTSDVTPTAPDGSAESSATLPARPPVRARRVTASHPAPALAAAQRMDGGVGVAAAARKTPARSSSKPAQAAGAGKSPATPPASPSIVDHVNVTLAAERASTARYAPADARLTQAGE